MISKQKVTGKAMSIPAGISLAAGISILTTLVFSWLLAWLVITGRVGENAIGYGAMAILLMASYLGAILAAARVKHRSMMVCALSGAAYFLCLLACTALFFGGQYQGIGVSALIITVGSVGAALTDAARSGGHKKGRRKIPSR